MRPALVIVLCVTLGLVSSVWADKEKGAFAPDIEAKEWMNTAEPISLAELRGMVVVLFFWVSYHPGGENVMPLMTIVNSRIGRSRGVFLIGLTDADRKRVEDMLKKQLVQFPIGLESKSYDDYEIKSFPRVVIVDANGKIAWSGTPGEKGGEPLVKEILSVIAETPPTKTHPEEAAQARAALQHAREALNDDNYREAFKAARKADEHALTGDTLKTNCQDMLDLIEALGRDKFAQAERAVEEKRFDDAVSLLREVRRDFEGLDVARNAKKKLEALKKKYADIARILERDTDATVAENLLGEALDEIRNRRFGEAYEQLEEIIREYSTTPAAGKAQTVLDRLRKNEGVMGYVKDHQASRECQSLLSQARAYIQAGRPEKAKQLLRIVIDKYPDTTWADEAAERLQQLP